ncbi:predicted protein [Meyerozyma guilliermondii ATCC 6260]|uniref:JAB1/MPN/MOV34 metalloenzyme domain-containing protein n=1 Tax=Meyerozyma guilliermondii (strain ATCC 6260 / CBS 566 / DSM 6381 / JCM 1539 / NBRC 10279 / NRRL Y-324) TaxID=294746 RepID=A5DNS4_PICGU|nr:uncharacterized protein PGUG_04925 [Meyerozyma guilliermondii ATCC 6260]EDK40827.2 predicted protein [Meyerozyma guilliermondii ATCC 6260]
MSSVQISPTLLFHFSELVTRNFKEHNYGIVLGRSDASEGVKYAQTGFEIPTVSNTASNNSGEIRIDMAYFQNRLRQMLTVWPQKVVVGLYVLTSNSAMEVGTMKILHQLEAFLKNLYGEETSPAILLVDPEQLSQTGGGILAFSTENGSVQPAGLTLSSDETEMIASTTIARNEKYLAGNDSAKFDDSGYTYDQLKVSLDRSVDILKTQVNKILAFSDSSPTSMEHNERVKRRIVQLSRVLDTNSETSDISLPLLSTELSLLTMQLASLDKLKAVSRKAIIGYKSYESYRPGRN